MTHPSPGASAQRGPDWELPVLGYTVFWRLSGVRIAREALIRALAETGLAAHVPAPPSPECALRRALAHLARARHGERLLLRTVSHAPCVLAVVEETPDQQGSLAYHTHLRARYDAGTRQVYATLRASGPIDASTEEPGTGTALRALFAQASETHTGEDLSRLLRAVVAGCQAVRLQRGVSFVPAAASEPLARLAELVERLPGAPLFARLAQVDERETRRRLVHAVHADLVRELERMETRLGQARAAHPQPETGTLCQQLVGVRALQQKARVYTELLGARVQEIQARLEALQAGVQRLVLLDIEDLLP